MRKENLFSLLLCLTLTSCGSSDASSTIASSSTENNSTSETSETSSEETSSSSIIEEDEDKDFVWNEDYTGIVSLDSLDGTGKTFMYDEDFFGEFPNIKHQQLYFNNVLDNSKKDGSVTDEVDAKYLYYNDSYVRFFNRSEGYALNLKTENTFNGDFSVAACRSKIYNKEMTLSVSCETSNPYCDSNYVKNVNKTTEQKGWLTYRDEWLIRYLNNKQYLNDNDLAYTSDVMLDDHDFKDEYSTSIFSIQIKNPGAIRKSYYNIGVLRDVYDVTGTKFYLFVLKSTTNRTEDFKEMLQSFTLLDETKGQVSNHLDNMELKYNDSWSEETKNYFDSLVTEQRTNWGFFVTNVGESSCGDMQRQMSTALDYDFEILPTYMHVSYNGSVQSFKKDMATKFAGGNGFNDKMVLQFSYQFTDNNNNVSASNTSSNYTPMFDILRGPDEVVDLWNKKDNIYLGLKQLAEDIKAYEKPVLFRLNNEMNSDWVSYCGLMTLVDPDIFIASWRYLYKIFMEEGVDNTIWIFNPIFKSCPYSSWSEDMSYFPGNDVCQALGLTYYEDNNSNNVNSLTFRKDYTAYYEKNNDIWNQYPWIISEFGCGSGGSYSGEAYRNQASQVEYINGMFADFNDRENNPYLQNIKGAVWFNVNDYNGSKVSNMYKIDELNLPLTIAAFKEGLSHNKKD